MTSQLPSMVGEKALVKGWVDRVRDHGKVVFVMLRDKEGVLQCVGVGKMSDLGEGDVVEISGVVKERPESMINSNIVTGSIELEVEEYKVLNKSKELPIPLNSSGHEVNEESRLKYRYVDLRRERLRKIVKLRSDYVKALREALGKRSFTEVETPMLTKATKEGARDFIVPSRHNPGKFYALPQSPQQYKQLLMTAGVERYFQFARCIRDEDLRADRGYEHTQLDMEMSFLSQKEVMNLIEGVVTESVLAVGGNIKETPFPVIQYKDAMEKYGSDRPDLRSNEDKEKGVLAFAWVVNFPFFKKVDTGDAAELRDGKSGWVFTHNPFSHPVPEHLEWHMKGENIGEILTTQYDLVCNGYEIGGGSIRAHTPEILRQTYRIMGYSDEQINESVGHMLEAFELGTPPHGGVGLGLDRHVMLLAGEDSLKEVIAFPMTSTGKTSVMDAPSSVPKEDLNVLHIEVSDKGDETMGKIIEALKQDNVEYKLIEHTPVRTSEEAAQVRGTKISDGAKAMVLKSQEYPEKYIMVVIPADKQIDLMKVSENLKEKFAIANGKEVEEYTGIKMGGVPPFGRFVKLNLYFDRSMWEKDSVAFNCGRKDRSIVMKASDLIKTAGPDSVSKEMDFIA